MLLDFKDAKMHRDDEGRRWFCFRPFNTAMAQQFIFNMKGRIYTAEVKEHREKRSKDANAYFWALVSKMADALRTSKGEVYLEMLKRYGVQEVIAVRLDALDMMLRHLKYAEVDERGHEMATVRVFMGSSTYDTKQMSVLIDGTVSECKELGIETATPEEQARLLNGWPG